MINKIKAAANKYNMFDSVDTVTVALSGGADSVALLHALLQLKDEFGFTVNAAHLNHCIRGDEADRDEAFVKDLCEKLGIELFCQRTNVPLYAETWNMGIELAARHIRYEFLTRVAKGVVATAHTASDNIETLLFNISRGAGLEGICGIPAKRDRIVRPIIFATREDVEKYCEDNKLRFCTDSTNADVAYSRNRIRLKVVPELLKVNDGAVLNALRLCNNLSDDADFIDGCVDVGYQMAYSNGGLMVDFLQNKHISIKRRMIARLCKETAHISPEEVHIKAICEMLDLGKSRVSFKGDYEATVRKGILRLEAKPLSFTEDEVCVKDFPFAYNNVILEKKNIENKENLNNLLLKRTIDCDKICGELVLRHRKTGDSIKIYRRNGTKTVKKLFNEAGMSAEDRINAYLLCDEKGVVWVQNFGISERVAVDENTKCVIIVNNF